MPKPDGTYLQTQKINKISLRADQSKHAGRVHDARIRKEYLRKFDLSSARNTAYLAHELGTEPTDRGNVARRALADLVDQLGEMKGEIDELTQTFAEIREPHFEFRAVTHGYQTITASNVLAISMAAITLLTFLEKAIRGKTGKR